MSGNKGLSILIPVYNFNVIALVNALKSEALKLEIPFEIRCYDDCSDEKFRKINHKELAHQSFVVYEEMPTNLGRSKIRNRLAQNSLYENLLFIDGDSKVISKKYLENYILKAFSHDVVIGGTAYIKNIANPECTLRWKYGKSREELPAEDRNLLPYQSFTINNTFIRKDLFLSILLDESITTYGHEDTKFGFELKKYDIPVIHIDNPIEHIGLETNQIYLDKTTEGIKNFYIISQENLMASTSLYKSFKIVKKLFLTRAFRSIYNLFKGRIQKNLISSSPSLFYFDLYKLNLLIEEDQKHRLVA